MVILFLFWFVLQWQFPSWLWILTGFFYVISLRPKKKIKKQISFRTQVLPFSLVLAIIFGVSFAWTTPYPRLFSKILIIISSDSLFTFSGYITSTSFMYLGGLKK